MKRTAAKNRTRRQIRVLSGPLHGTVHIIKCRLHIGRAGSSDIQLIDDDVSRQHAEIIENIYGEHVLVDLDSSNGTLIDGHRIARIKLEPGTIFEIMRTRFIYEDAVEQPLDQGRTKAHPTTNHKSLRETTDYSLLDLPAPVQTPRARPVSVGRTSADGQGGHQMRAIDESGVAYEGDLVGDILRYRRLLARFLRGKVEAREELELLSSLESRLQVPDDEADSSDHATNYRRFFCSVPSRVRFAAVGSIPAVMIDFGVDGAQILAYHHGLLVNSIVWLSMDIMEQGQPRTVVFTSRVQWSSNNYAGLLFTGEPIQSQQDRSLARMETRRDLRTQTNQDSAEPLVLRRVDRPSR